MILIPLESTTLTANDIAELAEKDTVILTRKGEPLTSVRDLSGSDWECVSLANDPKFQAMIERSRKSYAEQGGNSLEEVRKRLGLKPARRQKAKANGKKKVQTR